jgi:hypothetical protein
MPVYICRWQNGNVSAVSARSRDHAILLLDEFGNAEACELFPVKDFMVHFRLKDEADNIEGASPLELQGFGGEMLDMLYDCVYPVYAKACTEAVGAWTEDGPMPPEKVEGVLRKLNDALSSERTRQWGAKKQPSVRRFSRFPAQLSFAVTVDRAGKLAMLQGVSTDLGEGGIGGMVDGDLEPGEYVLLRISDSWLETQLEPRAQVCYRRDHHYGFAFFDVSPIAQADVRQLCGRLVSG